MKHKFPTWFEQQLAQSPLHCIDVGARGGLQSHWEPFDGLMTIDLFEPDKVACEAQSAQAPANQRWFPIALGGTTGRAILHVLQKPSGSSLYPPNPTMMSRFTPPNYSNLLKTIDVPVETLSHFIEQQARQLPNLLKLDVQGAELDILRGIKGEHFPETLAIQTEVEFVDMYKGQPLFHDVDAFMKQLGFVLFDLLPVRAYRYTGEKSHGQLRRHLNIVKNRRDISCRLIAGDALYLREPEQILQTGNQLSLLKLFLILVIYRFLDEALWLVNSARTLGRINTDEASELIAFVVSVAPQPKLVQRADKLGRIARKLSRFTGLGRARKSDYWLDRSWDF